MSITAAQLDSSHDHWQLGRTIAPFPDWFMPELPIHGEPDDADKLRVLADWFADRDDGYTERLLRWTANEFEWQRGLCRSQVAEGIPVWARWRWEGWSKALVDKVTPTHITIRHIRGCRRKVAWWDLETRYETSKPKPRKGYSHTTNARLAAMLCKGQAKPAVEPGSEATVG